MLHETPINKPTLKIIRALNKSQGPDCRLVVRMAVLYSHARVDGRAIARKSVSGEYNHGGKPGQLVVVSTPIGNMGDLSPRAAGLEKADILACEDTV